MKRILLILVMPLALQSSSTLADSTHDALKIDLERRALQYFVDHSNPKTGLVLDRFSKISSHNNLVASLGATGFGLIVMTNAAKRGDLNSKIDRKYAEAYAYKVLTFVHDRVDNFHGFYPHWLDWESGQEQWLSDYSTIDTALFVAGALYAGQVFQGRVAKVANQIYEDMDFYPMMTDGGAYPDRLTLSLNYSNKDGYSPWQWSIYAENMILYILGLGSPSHAMPPESWAAFDRGWGDIGEPTHLLGYDMPLFIHQYSQAFLDFRMLDDGQPNYFVNSQRATRFNRQIALAEDRQTYKAGFWGFSGGDSSNFKFYDVFSVHNHVSAACIGCVLGSAMFEPDLILGDVKSWLDGPYKAKIFGDYGLYDSLDLDHNWFSQDFLAITVGAAYMSLANTRDQTSIWADFMQIPAIKRAFAIARTVPPRLWHPPVLAPVSHNGAGVLAK